MTAHILGQQTVDSYDTLSSRVPLGRVSRRPRIKFQHLPRQPRTHRLGLSNCLLCFAGTRRERCNLAEGKRSHQDGQCLALSLFGRHLASVANGTNVQDLAVCNVQYSTRGPCAMCVQLCKSSLGTN